MNILVSDFGELISISIFHSTLLAFFFFSVFQIVLFCTNFSKFVKILLSTFMRMGQPRSDGHLGGGGYIKRSHEQDTCLRLQKQSA